MKVIENDLSWYVVRLWCEEEITALCIRVCVCVCVCVCIYDVIKLYGTFDLFNSEQTPYLNG